MNWKEYVGCTGKWSLCDLCGEAVSEEDGYYIALIDSWYCKTCLEAYLKGAKRYKSDMEKEQKNFVDMKTKLVDMGVWEN